MKASWHSPMGAPLMREIFLLIVCAFSINVITAHAQTDFEWIPVNEGLEGDVVPTIWQSPSGSFFAGGIGGLFRSNGLGAPWNATELVGFDVGVIRADSSGVLFAGTRKGIYISNDDGITWHPGGFEEAVFDITLTKDDTIIIATSSGILAHDQVQNSWDIIGQWTRDEGNDIIGITSIAVTEDGRIWASVFNSIYYTRSLNY